MHQRSINWLLIKEGGHQGINAVTLKFVNNSCPFYLNQIFEFALVSTIAAIYILITIK